MANQKKSTKGKKTTASKRTKSSAAKRPSAGRKTAKPSAAKSVEAKRKPARKPAKPGAGKSTASAKPAARKPASKPAKPANSPARKPAKAAVKTKAPKRPAPDPRVVAAAAAAPRGGGARPSIQVPGKKAVTGPIKGPIKTPIQPPRGRAVKKPAPPLLLLPLRLEYRLRKAGDDETVAAVDPRRIAMRKRREALLARGKTSPRVSPFVFRKRTPRRSELLVRWFPDDPFAEQSVMPASDEERAALAAFDQARDGRPWHQLDDPAVAAAWQAFASAVGGVYRAVQLARHGAEGEADWEEAYGRLFALPERVALYTMTKGRLAPLAEGAPIRDGLRYVPDALGEEQWLTHFGRAEEAGMAVTLSDPTSVSQALGADWVVAVGIAEGDRSDELERFLGRAVSTGRFALLEQDVPTNNSSDADTPFESVPRDSVAAARAMSYRERPDGRGETDADRLADALGVDPKLLHGAPGGGNRECLDARAMARVILPGLVDTITSTLFSGLLPGVERDGLVAFLAERAAARGPLPAVRLGRNPYGVLPIAAPDALEAPNAASEAVFDFARGFAHAVVEANGGKAGAVPVIEPGDSRLEEKLEQILALNPVSVTARVGGHSGDPKALGCPYVKSGAYDPADYLNSVGRLRLSKLEKPGVRHRHPLLYRLALLSREVLARDLPKGSRRADPDRPFTPVELRRMRLPKTLTGPFVQFNAALAHLAERPAEELEVLLMEVLDLVNHRADAWLTGLAQWRLEEQRAHEKRTRVGYYGFIGQPNPKAVTGSGDGYIQAPGVNQAVTAGLLRSASRRFAGEGAFQIDLSSRRARKGLALLGLLRGGLTLREALGHRAERWLHDHGGDREIHSLRKAFPLAMGEGDGHSNNQSNSQNSNISRLLDGLAFAEASAAYAGAACTDKAKCRDAHKALADEFDALSDLVMAEAMHQLASGNSGAANAWVKVLSGGAAPLNNDFLAIRRAGQSSAHRVSLVLAPAAAAEGAAPRSVAEPTVADLAAELAAGFERCAVGVALVPPGAGEAAWRAAVPLSDLGMTPVDLLIGGANEIVVRARWSVTRAWRTGAALGVSAGGVTLHQALGPFPDENPTGYINQTLPLHLDLDHGRAATSANALLAALTPLRRMLGKGRALEATDLNAASEAEPLSEALIAARVGDGVTVARGRADALHGALDRLIADLGEAAGEARVAADEMLRMADADVEAVRSDRQWERVIATRDRLDGLLEEAARFALPQALRLFSDAETVTALEAYFGNVTAVLTALEKKRAALAAAIARDTAGGSERRDLEARRTALIGALRQATDGDALAVLLPFTGGDETRPAVKRAPVAKAIGDWPKVRPALNAALELAATHRGFAAWVTDDRATGVAESADPFNRPESEVPPVRYHGTHIGRIDGPLGGSGGGYCGVVVDEWSDFRPSAVQNTALAVNYDSPQSEPPHVLLLGVAGGDEQSSWSEAGAAALVGEAIRLMRVRALPAADGAFSTLGYRGFNLVPPGTDGKPRLPVRNLKLKLAEIGALAEVQYMKRLPSKGGVFETAVMRAKSNKGRVKR